MSCSGSLAREKHCHSFFLTGALHHCGESLTAPTGLLGVTLEETTAPARIHTEHL